MTYIKKTDSNYSVLFGKKVTHRIKKHCELITDGYLNDDYLVFDHSINNLNIIIKELKKNGFDYYLDDLIRQEFEMNETLNQEFDNFTSKAKNIKYNPYIYADEYANYVETVNKSLTRKLYDYQMKASFHLAFSINACNFSVPGSGKTSIVYGAYSYLLENKKVEKILIIGPLSSKKPWELEYYENFGKVPDLCDISSLSKHDKKEYLTSNLIFHKKINFINYEGLSDLTELFIKFISNSKTMVVLDEAHKIKNPDSLRSKKIMKFSEYATSKIILTGTPMPNGYPDLYNLFEFLWPNKNIVGLNYFTLKSLSKKQNPSQEISRLMDNISPFYVRISKENLNLPPAVFHDPIRIKMTNTQHQIYSTIADDYINDTDDFDFDYELIIQLKKAKLIRLMQTLTNPTVISKSEKISELQETSKLDFGIYSQIKNYDNLEIPLKYKETLRLVNDILNRKEKVIIWTIFTYNLRSLGQFLTKSGIYNELLYGDIDNINREKIIENFHNDSNLNVLIANPAAVSESISLHKVCNNAIYVDLNFNAANYMQSKDRIHRVGLNSDRITNYYFILFENTIDEVIYQRVLDKENKMIGIIEGEQIPLFEKDFGNDISENDLELIENYLSGVK